MKKEFIYSDEFKDFIKINGLTLESVSKAEDASNVKWLWLFKYFIMWRAVRKFGHQYRIRSYTFFKI